MQIRNPEQTLGLMEWQQRMSSALTMRKMAVLPAIPSASERIATVLKPGFFVKTLRSITGIWNCTRRSGEIDRFPIVYR
jgi:hypothetical protein